MDYTRQSRLDKVRLVIYSSDQKEFRQFEFNLKRIFFVVFVCCSAFAGIFISSAVLSSKLSLGEEKDVVARVSESLLNKVGDLEENIEHLGDRISLVEDDTEDLEVLAGLRATSDVTSGASPNAREDDDLVISSLPVDFQYETDKMSDYLNMLESRLRKAENVQGLIEDRFIKSDKRIEHIPSIKPVTGARITDKFGTRRDPFVKRTKHHNGIDLRATYGTKVYAAAAGVVEFTRTRYRKNTGYGRVVVINHGYGYKTLYGHLSRINVKRGQRVERWTLIAKSGDTGRATGPHLHYEVWHNGHPQNPEEFILD